MTRTICLVAVVVALVKSMVMARGASAHIGDDHTGSALGDWTGPDGIALLGVVLAAGIGIWLLNRDNGRDESHEHLERNSYQRAPSASHHAAPGGIARRETSIPANPLVASRPLPPARHSKAGNRSLVPGSSAKTASAAPRIRTGAEPR